MSDKRQRGTLFQYNEGTAEWLPVLTDNCDKADAIEVRDTDPADLDELIAAAWVVVEPLPIGLKPEAAIERLRKTLEPKQ